MKKPIELVRVILTMSGSRTFNAHLEGTGEVVAEKTPVPVVVAARTLLKAGRNKKTRLTARHEGKEFDSFIPMTLKDWIALGGDEVEETVVDEQA